MAKLEQSESNFAVKYGTIHDDLSFSEYFSVECNFCYLEDYLDKKNAQNFAQCVIEEGFSLRVYQLFMPQ